MSALVKTIKSRLTDDTIYPVTKADAVYMGSSTVTTVEGQINDLKDIVGNSSLPSVNDTITSLIGSETMGTTATTITGAIAQHEQDIDGIHTFINTRSFATFSHPTGTETGNLAFIRYGALVLFSGAVQLTSTLTNGVILFSGLPTPYGSLAGFRCFCSSTGNWYDVYVDELGNVRVAGSYSAIGWYRMSGGYLV